MINPRTIWSHMPRRYLWHEAVGQGRGHISRESMPLWIWLLDKWLEFGDEIVHTIDRRLPHDERGWTAIDRLTPYYGNPICAAYLTAWHRWREDHTSRDEVNVEVPLDKLSTETQEWYRREFQDEPV